MRVALLTVVLLASSALAQPKSPASANNPASAKKLEAETAYKHGQALYMKEDYEGAAKQFKAAYDLDPDPVYLFNVAQAMRLAKKCADASTYYKRFLVEAKKAPNEEVVKQYIVEVDECAKQQEPPKVEPLPVEQRPELTVQPSMTEEHRSGGTKRLIGYGVTGFGAVSLGLGFYFMTRVSHWETVANDACPGGSCEWNQTAIDDRSDADKHGKRAEKLMVGGWIVGAAAVGAGVYLILTGGPQAESSSIAITPTRNGAMMSFDF